MSHTEALPAPPAAARKLPSFEERIVELLSHVGNPGRCRGCDAPIFWVRHKNGKIVPYSEAGVIHFVDCPEAQRFKRQR